MKDFVLPMSNPTARKARAMRLTWLFSLLVISRR